MKIKSISVLQFPRDKVWLTIRDRLPDLVHFLDDIEEVTVQSRAERPDGTVELVNIWQAKPNLPALVSNHLKPEMFAWTDQAEYRAGTYECHWRLEPHFFSKRIQCSGVTRYESALGGRGTRVTFDGNIDLSIQGLPGVPALLEGTVASAVESFLTVLVPKNFRKLTAAVEKFLESPAAAGPPAKKG
jgi:hypothetical protein